MSKMSIREKTAVDLRTSMSVSPDDRAAILRRTRGAWKGSAKKSLRALAQLRRGWERAFN